MLVLSVSLCGRLAKSLMILAVVLCGATAVASAAARHIGVTLPPAPTETILYDFSGTPDGANPEAPVIEDAQGVLYGTTISGGAHFNGTAFALTPKGSQYAERVLYSFGTSRADAAQPSGPLTLGSGGVLYGTTNRGGHSPCTCGTAFVLAPNGSTYAETILHAFLGARDGMNPVGGLLIGSDGALFGVTSYGGDTTCRGSNSGQYGCGTVFRLTSKGGRVTETVLYRFVGGVDGRFPYAGVVADGNGNFFGTTSSGGNGGCGGTGCGVVFELKAAGAKYTESVLYRFKGKAGGFTDGAFPVAPVLIDNTGALFGTTESGGTGNGIVYKLTPTGNHYRETVLHKFKGHADGAVPVAGLVEDASGVLYGTTVQGGSTSGGTVFSLTPQGSTYAENIVHQFGGPSDGTEPGAALLLSGTATFFGTTGYGGISYSGSGTVFALQISSAPRRNAKSAGRR